MKPDFSEFSYGYAVTEELVRSNNGSIIGSPIFPSLIEEGRVGGYDVEIPILRTPLFLQFKLSDYLQKRNAKEIQNGLYSSPPYYRMHLRPTKHSNQHELLRDLEQSGETVFYIAPQFHSIGELNHNYLSSRIVENSAIFSPNEIGTLPDDDEHYVVFRPTDNEAYRCSDERKIIKKHVSTDGFTSIVEKMGIKQKNINEEEFDAIGQKMLKSLSKFENKIKHKPIDIDSVKKVFSQESPYISVPYIANSLFDSTLVLV